jgi:two-component system, NarL family, response regulator NreC
MLEDVDRSSMPTAPNTPIRVLIADDHRLVRESLAVLINLEHGFRVVAQAADGLEAFEAAARDRPDVAIIDLGLPKLNGIEVTRRIKRELAGIAVVVITGSLGASAVHAALEGGADGYVPKETDPAELLTALERVVAGGSYVSPTLACEYVPATQLQELTSTITVREREIIALIVRGYSSSDIAAQLGISVATVRKHRENLMRKLQLSNAAELAAVAIRCGIV